MTADYKNSPQQHPQELAEFVAFLRSKSPMSYLELGSDFGGCLWAVAEHALAPQSVIVAVDLPNPRRASLGSLQDCIDHLRRHGHNANLIIGDSTNAAVIEQVRRFAPFDAIFIDANHTEKYVRADWANYGRMGSIVCFHDINWYAPTKRRPIDVPKVWAEIKNVFKDSADFKEIKCDPAVPGRNGIGIVMWR